MEFSNDKICDTELQNSGWPLEDDLQLRYADTLNVRTNHFRGYYCFLITTYIVFR